MELIYFYVKEVNGLKFNNGLSLSSKYIVEHDTLNNSRNINIKKKENYIDNFYGYNIVEVTALVGDNGVGKTTLLNLLDKVLKASTKNIHKYIKSEFILIYEEKTNYFYFSQENDSYEIYLDDRLVLNKKHLNFSRCHLLSNSKFNNSKYNDLLNCMIFKELYSDRFSKRVIKPSIIDRMYSNVSIKMKFQHLVRKNKKYYDNDFISRCEQDAKIFNKDNVLDTIFINLLTEIQYELCKQGISASDSVITANEVKTLIVEIKDSYESFELCNEKMNSLLKKMWCIKFPNTKRRNIFLKKVENLSEILKYINPAFEFFNSSMSCGYFALNENVDFNYTNQMNLNLLLESSLNKNSFLYGLIQINTMNLSSGELQLLSLIGRVYKFLITTDQIIYGEYDYRKISNSTSDISSISNSIILIDEIDESLHPSWQQSILSDLLESLKPIYRVKFQLIFSTHSPIILSDFTSDRINKLEIQYPENYASQLFIQKNQEIHFNKPMEEQYKSFNVNVSCDKNCENQSFGASIDKLYYDNFFLNNGSIGMFAKEKVRVLFDFLKRKENCRDLTEEECNYIIKNIGDTFIKHILEKLKDEIYDTNK